MAKIYRFPNLHLVYETLDTIRELDAHRDNLFDEPSATTPDEANEEYRQIQIVGNQIDSCLTTVAVQLVPEEQPTSQELRDYILELIYEERDNRDIVKEVFATKRDILFG